MDDWDWETITTGEWWFVVLALVSLLVGAAIGYAIADRRCRERGVIAPPLV